MLTLQLETNGCAGHQLTTGRHGCNALTVRRQNGRHPERSQNGYHFQKRTEYHIVTNIYAQWIQNTFL